MVSATKDPDKVRAGQLGAVTRWGSIPRVVRLDALDPNTRDLVVALIRGKGNATEARTGSEGS